MRAAVLLCCLTGCDALFRLAEVSPDAPGVPGDTADARDDGGGGDARCATMRFTERFSGTTSDLGANWDFSSSSNNCGASVTNGELAISVNPNVTCYAELRLKYRPLVGAELTVKVPRTLTPSVSQTYFALYQDDNNYYYFDSGSTWFDAALQIDGQDILGKTVTYNPVTHLYWRFKHDPFGKVVEFWTSPTGTNFTFMHSIATDQLAVGALRVALGAGTYDGGQNAPGTALFDDFELCVP